MLDANRGFLSAALLGPAAFRSAGAEDARGYTSSFSQPFAMTRVSRRSRIVFAHARRRLPHVCMDLVDVECDEPFVIAGPELGDRYLVQIAFSGRCTVEQGSRSFTADAGSVFVINPFAPSKKRWSGGCQQLMLWVERTALDRVLADELGRRPSRRLEVLPEGDPVGPADTPELRRLVDLATEAAVLAGDAHWRLVRQLERSVLVALLTSLSHTYRADLDRTPSDTVPYYVRRAECFLREHFAEPIDMRDVVEAAGTSARSLYYGFRTYRGTTPVAYLKQLRLSEARTRLLAVAERGGRVTDVALECGYTHLGMFARDYRARYGESPSESRKRGGGS
jgi:AraC-like DNA-binding protein